jgi:hypothetical protein
MIVSATTMRRCTMRADVGDRIVIRSHRIGEPTRDGEVLDTGPDGEPPFRVRWSDTGHEGLFFPGSDAYVEHFEAHEHGASGGGDAS